MGIKILDKVWKVRYDKQNSVCLNGDLLGICKHDNYEIVIANDMENQRERDTIAHELTHAIIRQLMDNKQSFTQEELCTFVEIYHKFINDTVDNVLRDKEPKANVHVMKKIVEEQRGKEMKNR